MSNKSHFVGMLNSGRLEADVVEMRRSDGVRVELQLAPKPGRGERSEATRLFDTASRTIQAEWKKRSGPNMKRDLGWLTITAYEIIGEILRLEQDYVFRARVEANGRYRRGRIGDPNSFQLGLMALFADDPIALNARDRERIGKRLWRAYRHYVPAEFLVGFLMQPEGELLPGHDLSRDFQDWIIARRAEENSAENESRGEYPVQIEEAVEQRQRLRRVAKGEDDEWDDA